MIFLKYLFIFCLFSLVGWILELIYRSFVTKKVVNPGFMTGCVVPLYGFGAIILNILCNIFSNINSNFKIVYLFILSIILLSSLEYITGYILLKFFNTRLWDYSYRKFNVNGFICLQFSITWGVLSILFCYFVFPWIGNYSMNFISNTYCLFSLGIFFGAFLVDLFISIDLLKKLNEYSKIVKEIISLEKIKMESLKVSRRKKVWKAVYPYISYNKFLKDKIKKK